MLKKLNIILSLFFIFISVVGIYLSSKLPTFGNEASLIFSMKPSFYPTIIFSLLFLSSAILAIKTIVKSNDDIVYFFNNKVLIVFASYVLYIIMLPFLQFIISSIIFFVISSFYLLADKNKYNFIILSIVNIASTAILYFLFVIILNVPI